MLLLSFLLLRTLWAPWLGDCFLSHMRDVFNYSLFTHFLRSFLSSPPWVPIMRMLVHLMSQGSLRLSLLSFIPFSLFSSVAVISPTLSSSSFLFSSYSFFCLRYSAIDSFQCIFHFSQHVVHHCRLFFSSSRSLLNMSYIFLICAFILFLRSWIILSIITMNYFWGRLSVSASLSCCSGVLSCFFFWNIFLCHLILSNFVYLWSLFLKLQDCNSSCFWWVSLVQRLVQPSWWDGLETAHWWVELGLCLLVDRACV